MPRHYNMNRRAAAAAETRRRIVEATYQLHAEKGIAATTFRDIASRADVAVGTVFHHFPTYDDVIDACGAHTMALTRPPDVSIFKGLEKTEDRIRALVAETFAFYSRFPTYGRVYAERLSFRPLEEGFRELEETRRQLVGAALRPSRSSRAAALAFALLDFNTYQSLIQSGLDHQAAVEEITTLLLNRLSTERKQR